MDDSERRKRKRKRDRKRRERAASRYTPAPGLAWPAADKPAAEFSDGECYAVLIHPMVTGLGAHPRTVSDEDWVNAVLTAAGVYGPVQVVTDIVDVLLGTDALWNDWSNPTPGGKVGPYPASRSGIKLPMTTVDTEGDRWTPGMVAGMVLNPVYVGVGGFPPYITKDRWVRAFVGDTRGDEDRLKQNLVDMLFALKKVFGFPGNPERSVPFGYVTG